MTATVTPSGAKKTMSTRRDRPAAYIIPADRGRLRDVRAAVAGLRELRKEIAARQGCESQLPDAEIKSLIEAGRR